MSSQQESVAPGKVNNLISFFEKQCDETPGSTTIEIKQNHYQSQNDKQSVIMNFFSNEGQQQQQQQQYVSKEVSCDDQHQTNGQPEDKQSYEETQTISNDGATETHQILNNGQEYKYDDVYSDKLKKMSDQEEIEKDKLQFSYQCQQEKQEIEEEKQEYEEKQEKSEQLSCSETISYQQNTVETPQYNEVAAEESSSTQQLEKSGSSENCDLQQSGDYEDHSPHNIAEVKELSGNFDQLSHTQHFDAEMYDSTTQNQNECSSHEAIVEQSQSESISTQFYENLPKHLTSSPGTPTICPVPYFDPEGDAKILKKAMKGLGTDEKAIIEVITQRNNLQRQEISVRYTELFGKDLIHELRKELSGDFEDIIIALMTPSYKFLAQELKRATKGAGTDEDTLIEILCSYDDEDIRQIQQAYLFLYGTELKDDVYNDTSGQLRKIFLSILAACREESKSLLPHDLALQLCETDEKGKTTLTSDVIRTILVTYPRSFLYMAFDRYESQTGKSFEEIITKVSSSDIEKALLTLYQSIICLPTLYAEELRNAMKGVGTKDCKLIRLIVSRSEIDLQDIKDDFLRVTGKDLAKEVKSETSGDYQKALLAVIEGCHCSSNLSQDSQQSQI